MSQTRPVFYVSDGTGITAETIGHSLLTQFTGPRFVTDRLSFVDTVEKADEVAGRIRAAGEAHGARPIVVNSCVDANLTARLSALQSLDLPLGWDHVPPVNGAPVSWFLQQLVGLLLTTLAITLGAPFWFDALGKIMTVKTTGA